MFIAPGKTHTVQRTHTTYHWERLDAMTFQWGDIQLRLIEDKPYQTNWWYFVKVNGQWRKAWTAQRPWGYGHPMQAFVGFSKIKEFIYE